MKAIDIYKNGLIISGTESDTEFLLGNDGNPDELFFVNKALADLNLPLASGLYSEIELNGISIDTLCAGVAYYLALRASDRERISYLSGLYSSKRAAALSKITRVKCSPYFKNQG